MNNKLTPETDIHKSDFTVRALNVLKRANGNNDWWNKGRTVETLKDVSEFSEEELYALKGCGIDSFTEIKDKIESVGLTLSKDSNRRDWDVYGYDKFKKYATLKNY